MTSAFLALQKNGERIIAAILRHEGKAYRIDYDENEKIQIESFWSFYRSMWQPKIGLPSLYCHNGARQFYKYLLKYQSIGPIKQLGTPDRPYAWQFTYRGTKLTWFDTAALIPANIQDIGKNLDIDIPKIEIVGDINTQSEKYKRLIDSLEAEALAIENHKNFYKDFQVRRTLASTAFRTLFDAHRVVRFTDPSFDSVYRGGYTECFSPTMKDVHQVDINSSYMYEASRRFPNPYVQPTYTKDRDHAKAGIYYIDVEKTNLPISPLSIYSDKNNPTPLDKSVGGGVVKHYNLEKSKVWATSSEIEFLEAFNQDFTILHGFEVPYLSIQDKIEGLYKQRQTDATLDYPIKLLMNMSLGEFGKKDKVFTSFVSPTKLEVSDFASLMSEHEINSYTGNSWCTEIGNGFLYRLELNRPSPHRNILVVSNVNSGAKINLLTMAYVAGIENVQYVDTDSLTLNDDGFQNLSKLIGKGLGQLKLVEEASRSRIYARKFYRLDGVDGCHGIVLKTKGIPSYIKTHITSTGAYTSKAYADGFKESTLIESVRKHRMTTELHKMFDMDLRRYREFDGAWGKPYKLSGVIQSDYIGSAQTGITNWT